MSELHRHLHDAKVREDDITVESHALWNFGRRPRSEYANRAVEDLHPWRAHYPIQRVGVHAPKHTLRVSFGGLIWHRSQDRTNGDQRMALPNEHSTTDAFLGTEVVAIPRRYPSWISSNGDFDPRHLRWVASDRDWHDIKEDVMNLLLKPINLLKRWLQP